MNKKEFIEHIICTGEVCILSMFSKHISEVLKVKGVHNNTLIWAENKRRERVPSDIDIKTISNMVELGLVEVKNLPLTYAIKDTNALTDDMKLIKLIDAWYSDGISIPANTPLTINEKDIYRGVIRYSKNINDVTGAMEWLDNIYHDEYVIFGAPKNSYMLAYDLSEINDVGILREGVDMLLHLHGQHTTNDVLNIILTAAARKGNLPIVKYIASLGISRDYLTALYTTAWVESSYPVLEWLIDTGINSPNDTATHIPLQMIQKLNITKHWLTTKAKCDKRLVNLAIKVLSSVKQRIPRSSKLTPTDLLLKICAYLPGKALAKKAIALGAEPIESISLACKNKNKRLVKYLLSRGITASHALYAINDSSQFTDWIYKKCRNVLFTPDARSFMYSNVIRYNHKRIMVNELIAGKAEQFVESLAKEKHHYSKSNLGLYKILAIVHPKQMRVTSCSVNTTHRRWFKRRQIEHSQVDESFMLKLL